jgi:hypothetical protein
MKQISILAPLFVALALFVSTKAIAGCDQSKGDILSKHLRPVIESLDCALLKQPGLTDKGHKLVGVCYQFFGQISRITLDAHLSCRANSEDVNAKIFGTENAPGVTENIVVDAEVGEDCHLYDVKALPSGNLGRLLANLFKINGEGRKALEEGLATVCKAQ